LSEIARSQYQWEQTCNYLLQALEIFRDYNDTNWGNIVMSGLARLWRDSGEASVPVMIAQRFEMEVSEIEALLRGAMGDGSGEET
jgi:hypothetical protein